MDVADFDGTGAGIDAKVAGDTDRPAACEIDDGVELRIGGRHDAGHPCDVSLERLEGPVWQIGPVRPVSIAKIGLMQMSGVRRDIEWLYPADILRLGAQDSP